MIVVREPVFARAGATAPPIRNSSHTVLSCQLKCKRKKEKEVEEEEEKEEENEDGLRARTWKVKP